MIKHEKSSAFYDTFERKGAGDRNTHYCPGCGHGTVHKLIAEAIEDLKIQDRVVFHSPVGCSVFAYYYFDTGNIQCSHGRAPAVATGVRRTLDDAIIISYQGDGDLAGIGASEIVHAANRGENITVFFINNAIYGMTGGQMAPTTLIGQKTLTTPLGRVAAREGMPIRMAEIMDAIGSPVYIERVSLGDAKGVLKTRKAVRKGLKNQIEGRGFSFVEILSPCPINWKMDPVTARTWLKDHLEPVFPVKKFRDLTDTPPAPEGHGRLPFLDDTALVELLRGEAPIPVVRDHSEFSDQYVKIAGFGGQGVLSAGILLAKCGIGEGLNSTWLPSYGPEMRGGKAYASVILSKDEIGSPVVDDPNVLIAMNGPSLDAFEDDVTTGGLIVVNSSIITRRVRRKDVQVVYIPASEIAKQGGLTAAANVVMITAYFLASGSASLETLRQIIPVSVKRKEFATLNLDLVARTEAWIAESEGRVE